MQKQVQVNNRADTEMGTSVIVKEQNLQGGNL